MSVPLSMTLRKAGDVRLVNGWEEDEAVVGSWLDDGLEPPPADSIRHFNQISRFFFFFSFDFDLILCYRTSSSTWRWAWDSHRPGSGQSKVGRPTRSHLLARHSKMAALNQPPRQIVKNQKDKPKHLSVRLRESRSKRYCGRVSQKKGAGDFKREKKINGNTHTHTHTQTEHTETHSHSVQQPKNMTGSQFQYANSPIIIIIRGLGGGPRPFSWWFSGCLHNGLASGGGYIVCKAEWKMNVKKEKVGKMFLEKFTFFAGLKKMKFVLE